MSERRACALTFETPDVIATCLLDPGHGGPHHDYGNGIHWGRPCLVCHERTMSEGQLCSTCIAAGHRVENDTLIVSFGVPGTHENPAQPEG